jgi:hypothetical protein
MPVVGARVVTRRKDHLLIVVQLQSGYPLISKTVGDIAVEAVKSFLE